MLEAVLASSRNTIQQRVLGCTNGETLQGTQDAVLATKWGRHLVGKRQ